MGEEIARLNKGLEMFKAAQARSGDLTMFADNLGRAKNCLDEAVKDNDFIYHERVPDVSIMSVENDVNAYFLCVVYYVNYF